MDEIEFEWDESKNDINQEKHAQYAFFDKNRIIAEDLSHSSNEERFFCFGLNKDKTGVLTVRFTYRSGKIRVFGAGYWRKGKKAYEQANTI